MIENILIRKQTPTTGKFLYRFDEENNRYFISTTVYLGKNDTEWDECDEAQKVEFEKHNEEVEKAELEKIYNEQEKNID